MKFYLSNYIVSKFPTLEKYKPGIEFLARLFFLAIVGFISRKFFWLISDHSGTLAIPLLGNFNPIEFLRTNIINATEKILAMLGYTTFISGWVVGIYKTAAVRIETPCLGINVCLVFIGLIMAYPNLVKCWQKGLFILGGLIIIQTFNLARMVAMVYVVKNQYHLPIEHHDLFNIIIYVVIFGLFYLFINWKTGDKIIGDSVL